MIMSRPTAVVVIAIVAIQTAFAVETIPDVKTQEDWAEIRPVKVNDDWEVRIGLGDSGIEGAPWKIIFCQASYTGKGQDPMIEVSDIILGETLGPVSFTWSPAESARALASKGKMLVRTNKEMWYWQAIPAAKAGKYRLQVFGHDEKVLCERIVTIEADQPPHWQTFVQERWIQGNPSKQLIRIAPDYAAHPDAGSHALKDGAPTSVPLPTRKAPQVDAHGLQISLKDNAFLIESQEELVDHPSEYLLARWWINGEPVLPDAKANTMAVLRKQARAVTYTKEFKIAFGLPLDTSKLKVDDKVSLQVFYSVGGHTRFPSGPMMERLNRIRGNREGMMLLSDRLDFELTPELLKTAQENEVFLKEISRGGR
jgi:hypothetical protein